MSLKHLLSGSIKTNVIFGFLIWIFGFLFGVYIYTKPINQGLVTINENILNYTTWYFFSKNFIVYNLIIITFTTLSILSLIILLFNGLVIGYFFVSHIDVTGGVVNSLMLFIPHFSEIIGFIIGFHISVYLSKNIILNLNNPISVIKDKTFIRNYLLGSALILIGATCEANLTPLFL